MWHDDWNRSMQKPHLQYQVSNGDDNNSSRENLLRLFLPPKILRASRDTIDSTYEMHRFPKTNLSNRRTPLLTTVACSKPGVIEMSSHGKIATVFFFSLVFVSVEKLFRFPWAWSKEVTTLSHEMVKWKQWFFRGNASGEFLLVYRGTCHRVVNPCRNGLISPQIIE